MSMLAERKRKQKWSLNPQGKTWAQDNNKFGQKLLEKMGWREGKGLGAREDGVKEHIKVKYKNDNTGIGFDDKDGWTAHEDNYTELLKNLSNSEVAVKIESKEDENGLQFKSLEKLSQSSRVRVHYHKFTRGKDLSRYSEKDLANIFGKKSLQEKEQNEKLEALNNANENLNSNKNSNDFGVKIIEGGSMVNYFRSKMALSNNNLSNINVEENSNSCDELPRAGFGFQHYFNGTITETESVNEKQRKKKSKAINNEESTNNRSFSFESENESLSAENSKEMKEKSEEPKKKSKKRKLGDGLEITPKKKKKSASDTEEFPCSKSKKKQKSSEDEKQEAMGLSNPAFDPLFSKDVLTEKHVLAPIIEDEEMLPESSEVFEESERKITRKKSKIKSFGDTEEEKNSSNDYEVKQKKKRKKDKIESFDSTNESEGNQCLKDSKEKKKKENCFENPNFDNNIACEDTENGVDNNMYEIKSKKKKKKSKGIENPNFNDYSPVSIQSEKSVTECNDSVDSGNGRKKKKSKNAKGVINPTYTETNFDDSIENEYKTKETKKKSKLHGIENPSLNLSSSDNDIKEESSLIQEKEQNNDSKKQENSTSSNSNSDFLLNVSDEPDIMLNISFGLPDYLKEKDEKISAGDIEPIRPSTKTKRRKKVRFSDVNEEREIPSQRDDNYASSNIQEVNELLEINSKVFNENSNGSNDKDEIFKNGLINEGFDFKKDHLENNIQMISKKFDDFNAEIDNDINESKANKTVPNRPSREFMIGEPVTEGDDEKLEDGTKLRLKNAEFGRMPYWMKKNDAISFAKKSYRHLIKGDIVLQFKNTNLHEIRGYGKKIKQKGNALGTAAVN